MGKWSLTSEHRLPESKSESKTLVNTLSISVALLGVIRVGVFIIGNIPSTELSRRKSLTVSSSLNKFILKSPVI